MAFEIVMPQLGWSAEEGEFGEWLLKDGDTVQPGDIVCVVESEKAAHEVEALDAGILRIPPDSPAPGTSVPVGTVLAYLVEPDEPAPFEVEPDKAERPSSGFPEPAMKSQAQVATAAAREQPSGRDSRRDGPVISPRALRVARELNVDWTQLKGSSRSGRIVERDVRAAASQEATALDVNISPVARRVADEAGIDLAELAARKAGDRIQRADVEAAIAERQRTSAATAAPFEGKPVPVTATRRTIAERMVKSAQTVASVTLNTDADATELMALRQQMKDTFEPLGRAVPTYTDLFIRLTALALQEYPMLNAVWNDTEILLQPAVHMGVAVDSEAGLLVPVVRDVLSKSLHQIADESSALAQKARARELVAEEMQGGTFTITNLGMYGIDTFTPLINLPQCAILGVGRIVSKPAVHDGQIVPRQMVALSLTFDHRVVDGGPAARFLNRIREFVEQPLLWLLS